MMKLGLLAALTLCVAESRVVLVTGATGRTGSLVYLALKDQGHTVRGVVRDTDKARRVLGCDKCDESEGIFVGDVKDEESLALAMVGAESLVITTAPAYKCRVPSLYLFCKYYDGADPKAMSWLAVEAQVSAFASSQGPPASERHVVLMSNTLTTQPNNFLDKVGGGHGCFYGLQGETFAMASGLPFTIVKASGLEDGSASEREIMVAHDDEGWSSMDMNVAFITREDVARLLTFAAGNPERAAGLRFDVTSKKTGGTPTTDVSEVFRLAQYPWDARAPASKVV